MRDRRSVLLVGMGGLGPWLLERLVRADGVGAVTVGDVDLTRAAAAASCAQLGVELAGSDVRVNARSLDLLDVERTTRLLDELRPDVIVQGASLLPVDRWWSIARQPDVGPRLQAAGLGPWLPLQLLLPMRLMEAMAAAASPARVVNLSYPDGVNAVLARLGHPAPLGAGNVQLLATAVRHAAAAHHGVTADRVQVRMAAHYAHLRWAMGAGLRPATHGVLRIAVDGRDETAAVDPYELLRAGGGAIPWGAGCHPLTAAALVDLIERIGGGVETPTHMPGACGLPGGYPVRVGPDGVRLDPPEGHDVEQLVAGQRDAQRGDGIDRIADDGTVTLTDEAADHMGALFGHRHRELAPDAVAARAAELLEALQR